MTRRTLLNAKRSFRPFEDQLMKRRSYVQVERPLHEDIATRLKILRNQGMLRCVYFPVPNGVFIPARTEEEKNLVRRIIYQMKNAGLLLPGVADWIFLWDTGCGTLEEKKPPTRTLLGTSPRGRLSVPQIAFGDWCQEMGVDHRVVEDWAGVLKALKEWGRV